MKSLLILILVTCFLSCGLTDEEKAARECNYSFKYDDRHYFKVPLTVTPNRLTYKAGDTLTITGNFSNKIEDINYERIFEIDSAFFRPIITIQKFDDGNYMGKVSGESNVLIDTLYKPKFGQSTLSIINFNNNQYAWHVKIVLRKKGRYVFTVIDNSYSSERDEGIFLKSLNFDGYCRYQGFEICYMVQGNTHFAELETELIYIDKELTYDNMFSIADRTGLGVYGTGSYAWEHSGTYGFIVE